MKVLVLANFAGGACGFRNFADQTVTALERAGHAVGQWDGTYPALYTRLRTPGAATYVPHDVASYDVVHVIYNALTLNHYSGAPWQALADLPGGGPLISWWDGGPSDTTCPFLEWMTVRWSDYPRAGYQYSPYPVPDWVTNLPKPHPGFIVGASSIRGDGVAEILDICRRHGWTSNLPTPGQWLSIEDEVRRLARSTVNVCWYNTAPIWHNRASAPSMLLAAGRPLVVNQDPLVAHLWDRPDVYHGLRFPAPGPGLEEVLLDLAGQYLRGGHAALYRPIETADQLSWTRATAHFTAVWEAARHAR